MKITNNFYLKEFNVSAKYPDIARKIKFTINDIQRIYILCATCLQPIRDMMGEEIWITSGKRSLLLNQLIRGSNMSDHLKMNAVDFTAQNKQKLNKVFELFIVRPYLPYGQAISYIDNDLQLRFIHISLCTNIHFQEKWVSCNGELTRIG